MPMQYPCSPNSFQTQMEYTKKYSRFSFPWALTTEGPWVTHQFSRLLETQNFSPSLTVILLPVKYQEKGDVQYISVLTQWCIGNHAPKNHVSASTEEDTEAQFLRDAIQLFYKFDTKIFNCNNTPLFCDHSSTGEIEKTNDVKLLLKEPRGDWKNKKSQMWHKIEQVSKLAVLVSRLDKTRFKMKETE